MVLVHQVGKAALIGMVGMSSACEPNDRFAAPELHSETEITQVYCRGARWERRIDVLFVVDDSPSMGPLLPTLAESLGDFTAMLEDPSVDVDYRIGIATTSTFGPGCEGANDSVFRMDSCRAHLDDFVVADTAETPGGGDYRQVCEDHCSLDSIPRLPSSIAGHAEKTVRPWIERDDLYVSNLEDGVSTLDALSCAGLAGAGGCRFESPLEAMNRAIDASFDHDDPAHGFIREDAHLWVIFITNEDDCSIAPAGATILDPDGERVFWPDDAAQMPQSGICWNAGTSCEPTGEDQWLDCEVAHRDTSGAITEEASSAVLHPVERYVDRLEDTEDMKRALNHNLVVAVSSVGGVWWDGQVLFVPPSATEDPVDAEFGIGPACIASQEEPGRRAYPTIRINALVDHFDGQINSACEDFWAGAFMELLGGWGPAFRPMCGPGCADDLDPATDGLDHDCIAYEVGAYEHPRALPECKKLDGDYLFENDDYVQPDELTNACAAFLSDREAVTPSPHDDLWAECDHDINIGLKVARRSGYPAPFGTCVRLICTDGGSACG